MNNEENNVEQVEQVEQEVVEEQVNYEEYIPVKKKKDKLFVILAVIVFVMTAAIVFMLVTKTGDGQSTVFERVFNIDMSKLDKERKHEEIKEEQPEEVKEAPVQEEKKEESKTSQKTSSKTNNKTNQSTNNNFSSSGSSSNKPVEQKPNTSTPAPEKIIHYSYIPSNVVYNAEVTRMDLAMMLCRINGIKPDDKLSNPFTNDPDVDKEVIGEYYGYVLAAYHNKLMSGVGDNKFEPKATIDRETTITAIMNLVLHIYKLNPKIDCKSGTTFVDINDASSWARGYIEKAGAMCISDGYTESGSHYFRPKKTVKMSELITFLARVYDRYYVEDQYTCDSPIENNTFKNKIPDKLARLFNEGLNTHVCYKK